MTLAKVLGKATKTAYEEGREEIDRRLAAQRRADEEKRVLSVLKKRARVHPQTHREIGAWSGIYNETVQIILAKFKRQGKVKFIPLKKCPTCHRQRTSGSGWLYTPEGSK